MALVVVLLMGDLAIKVRLGEVDALIGLSKAPTLALGVAGVVVAVALVRIYAEGFFVSLIGVPKALFERLAERQGSMFSKS